MNAPSHSPAWIALGWAALHVAWIGAAIGLAASIARRAMRGASPEARHAAALAGLLALAASPFAAFAAVYEPAPTTTILAATAVAPRPAAGTSPGRPDVAPGRPPLAAAPRPIARSSWFASWIGLLPGLWLAGTSLLLARTAAGAVGVERLRRSASEDAPGPVAERCRAMARSLGIARDVSIAACDRVAAPMLIGIVRPMVILPASALSGWDRDLVEMALLHELAHLRRLDNLTSLFQRFVEALVFFHPTTWWLSAWLRLERESCCDALVVARTGDRVGYARLLAALADARPPALAASLNERPITTRIRRILFMEDRPMTLKPTAPEALALAAAALLAASVMLPARAEPPAPRTPDAAADLRRLAEVVAAQPPGPKPKDGSRFDERTMTLVEIAKRQAERGDGPGALKTLEGVAFEPLSAKDFSRGEAVMNDFNYIEGIARVRRIAGDVAGGRDMYGRLAALVLACEPDPARDAAAARFIDDMVADRMGRVIGLRPDGSTVVVSVAVKGAGRDAERGDPAASMPIQLNMYLMERLAEWREIEAMRPLVDRLDSFAKGFGSPLTRAFLDAWTARAFRIAEDEEASSRRLATARTAFDAVPAGDEKDAATLEFALMVASVNRGQALEIIRPLGPSFRPGALRRLLGDLCRIEPMTGDIPAGLGINIGEPGLSVNDEAEARAELPNFVAAARELEDARPRARLLAILARLQAQAGDLAGAMATAGSIDLRRADHPGPADGFYDAVKPATFARIAAHRSRAGDRAGADAAFARSAELALAVTDGVERVVAGIVLADSYEEAGRRDDSATALADVLPLASLQPEPRRSRMLASIAEIQARAVGAAAALKTADAIRDEPGLEKAEALAAVAAHLRDSGDVEAARPIARRALACLAPKASDPKPIPGIQEDQMTHGGFRDYDAELKTYWLLIGRMQQRGPLQAIVGESTPIAPQDFARLEQDRLRKLIATYWREGLDGALRAVEAVESPRDRTIALRSLASAIPGEPVRN